MPLHFKLCSVPECAEKGSKLSSEFWADANQSDGRMATCIACTKRIRAERRAAKAQVKTKAKGVVESTSRSSFSEEERQRRSERAKRLNEEGRFGGAVFGAKGARAPRRARLQDAVLEHFRSDQSRVELVVHAYESNLRSRSHSEQLRAAEALRRMEMDEDKRLRDDRGGGKDPYEMTKAELEEFVAQGLKAMMERGELPIDLVLPESAVEEIA